MKTCSKCGVEKPESEFGKNARGAGGLMSCCKSCVNEYQRLRYANDPENARAKVAAYRERNPERVRASAAISYEKRKGQVLAYCRRWRKPQRGREWQAARKHNRRVMAGPAITADIVRELKAEYGGVCPYCRETIVNGHIDHIRPISKGGTNARENLVYCCATCNTQKGNKSLLQFLLYRCELAKEEACSDAS